MRSKEIFGEYVFAVLMFIMALMPIIFKGQRGDYDE